MRNGVRMRDVYEGNDACLCSPFVPGAFVRSVFRKKTERTNERPAFGERSALVRMPNESQTNTDQTRGGEAIERSVRVRRAFVLQVTT